MVAAVNSGLDLAGIGLAPPAEAARKDELGQEEFLNLMITQLKNQDPFKPLESGEFLGQLAQFGTVSGLAGLQTSFNSLASSLVSNQALQAAGLVGRTALVESGTAALPAGGVVEGAVDLPQTSGRVVVAISDARGEVVRRIDLGGQAAGLVRFQWDGQTDAGEVAKPGSYSIAAGFLKGNSTEAAATLVSAQVDSVVFGANGFSVQLRGLGELPFSAVREIRNDFLVGDSD